MRRKKKDFRAGDLVVIRTPPFHKSVLSEDLEGKSGVILGVHENEVPSSLKRVDVIFDVLIEGRIMQLYSDRYISHVK